MIIRFELHKADCIMKTSVTKDSALRDFCNQFLDTLHKIAQESVDFKLQKIEQNWLKWTFHDSTINAIFNKLELNGKEWDLKKVHQYMQFKREVVDPISLFYLKNVKENYRTFDNTSEFFQL